MCIDVDHQILRELGIEVIQPMKLCSDNHAAIHIASDQVFHKCTKHIKVDYHFRTNEQLANGLTLTWIRNNLGMHDVYAPTSGGMLRE